MGCDSMNEDKVNPNGKRQWCLWMQSIFCQEHEKTQK